MNKNEKVMDETEWKEEKKEIKEIITEEMF